MSLNLVALVGRITKDIELKRTAQGNAVANFTLAVNRNFSSTQEADFINCIVWNKQAENLQRYCGKGSQVSVEGRIQTRNYENNQGQKIYITEVIVSSVQFLDTKKKEEVKPVNDDPFKEFNSHGSTELTYQNGGNEQTYQNGNFDGNFDIMQDDIQF